MGKPAWSVKETPGIAEAFSIIMTGSSGVRQFRLTPFSEMLATVRRLPGSRERRNAPEAGIPRQPELWSPLPFFACLVDINRTLKRGQSITADCGAVG